MKCPNCEQPLRPVQLEHIILDSCPKCRGMWFGRGELQKHLKALNCLAAENAETADGAPKTQPVKVNAPAKSCPKCTIAMLPFRYSDDSDIIMDRCEKCSGIWTDSGELQKAIVHRKGNAAQDQSDGTGQAIESIAHGAMPPKPSGFSIGTMLKKLFSGS